MRPRRVIHHVLGPAGPLLIAAAVTLVPAAPAEAATARVTPAAVLTGTGVLNDVVAIMARNAWAVGHYGGLANPRTLVEHWNGTAWHRVSVSPAAGWLNGVAATSARDVWAVGFSGGRALILHFNGTAWRRVASPHVRPCSPASRRSRRMTRGPWESPEMGPWSSIGTAQRGRACPARRCRASHSSPGCPPPRPATYGPWAASARRSSCTGTALGGGGCRARAPGPEQCWMTSP